LQCLQLFWHGEEKQEAQQYVRRLALDDTHLPVAGRQRPAGVDLEGLAEGHRRLDLEGGIARGRRLQQRRAKIGDVLSADLALRATRAGDSQLVRVLIRRAGGD